MNKLHQCCWEWAGSVNYQDCCRKIEKRHLEVVWVCISIDVLAPDAAARALQACWNLHQYISPASTPISAIDVPQNVGAQQDNYADYCQI